MLSVDERQPGIDSEPRTFDFGSYTSGVSDADPNLLQSATESYVQCWKQGMDITGCHRSFNSRHLVVRDTGAIAIRCNGRVICEYFIALVRVDVVAAMRETYPGDFFPIGQCDPDETTKTLDGVSVAAGVSKTAKEYFRVIMASLSQEWCLVQDILNSDGMCINMDNLDLAYCGALYTPVVVLDSTFDEMKMEHPLSVFKANPVK